MDPSIERALYFHAIVRRAVKPFLPQSQKRDHGLFWFSFVFRHEPRRASSWDDRVRVLMVVQYHL
jgi:hypothetical protein